MRNLFIPILAVELTKVPTAAVSMPWLHRKETEMKSSSPNMDF